jgi:hypothetical protein
LYAQNWTIRIIKAVFECQKFNGINTRSAIRQQQTLLINIASSDFANLQFGPLYHLHSTFNKYFRNSLYITLSLHASVQ